VPWNKVNLDEQRMRFVIRALGGKERMSSLCREFWDFAAHVVLVAGPVPGERKFRRLARAESASEAQSPAHGGGKRRTRGRPAAADRLGSEEVARGVARRTTGAGAGANYSPHFGAARVAERSGASGGAAALGGLAGIAGGSAA